MPFITDNIQSEGYISGVTISATTFYGDGSRLIGVNSGGFTGGTVTGTTNFTNNVTATTLTVNTISATTYQNLPISQDTYVTGFTYNNSNQFSIYNNTGSVLNVIANVFSGITSTTINSNTAFTNTLLVNTSNISLANPERLLVDDSGAGSINFSNTIVGKANVNNYSQLNIQNMFSGGNSSSDVVATADNGNENINYIDMGINSSLFNGNLGFANDAYLYSTGNDLYIGNGTPNKNIYIFTDSTSSGNTRVAINNSSTTFNTTVSAITYYGDGSNLLNVSHTFTGTSSVNFGFSNGFEDSFTTTNVNDTNILPTSQVLYTVISSSDHGDVEDSLLDGVSFSTSSIVSGTGFTIIAVSSNNTWGTYNINYKIIN